MNLLIKTTDNINDFNNNDNDNHDNHNNDNDNVNDNNQHDEALKQRIEQIAHENLYDFEKIDKIKDLLLQDQFEDKKQGADYILRLIDREDWKYYDEVKLLEERFVLPAVSEEVHRIYNNYRNNSGELFAAELDKKIGEAVINDHMKYAIQNNKLTFDACVKNVFAKHINFNLYMRMDGLADEIETVKKKCYAKIWATGDFRWSPLGADIIYLEELLSKMESDETLHNLDAFLNGPDYREGCKKLKAWFAYEEYEPEGIYFMLTGHRYINDMAVNQVDYIGQYPVLHNLYKKIEAFVDSFVFGAGALEFDQLKNRVHTAAEEVREAYRQVVEFFKNNPQPNNIDDDDFIW